MDYLILDSKTLDYKMRIILIRIIFFEQLGPGVKNQYACANINLPKHYYWIVNTVCTAVSPPVGRTENYTLKTQKQIYYCSVH